MHPFLRRLIVPLVALTLTFPVRTAGASDEADPEYRIKAAFIYNFAQFIDWPSAFGSNGPFVIGIVGRDPFGEGMDALRSETLNHRPIEIRRFANVNAVTPDCRIVFVGVSGSRRVFQTLEKLSGRGFLTIGETPHFAEQGGAIAFVVRQNKVRFVINRRTAEREGLRINSQLLSLADRVIS